MLTVMLKKLKRFKILKVFNDAQLIELSEYISLENYNPSDVIFKEGDAGTAMYIIDKGDVEIRKKDKLLTKFTSGNIFGEMALYEKEKRSADAVAATKVTLYKINSQEFKNFIFKHLLAGSQFLFDNIKEMSRRLRRTSEYLTTIYDTGKIVGSDIELNDMTNRILKRLLEDIHESTGGMIILFNPFSEMFDLACEINMKKLDLDKAVEFIKKNTDSNICRTIEESAVLCVPLKDQEKILGYIILEKEGDKTDFTFEHEIIVSAVGNQVGLGILKAYSKKEEEARKRLEMNRMKGY